MYDSVRRPELFGSAGPLVTRERAERTAPAAAGAETSDAPMSVQVGRGLGGAVS